MFNLTKNVLKKFRSLKEVTISKFFGKTNPESPFWNQDGIKKKLREKRSLKKQY